MVNNGVAAFRSSKGLWSSENSPISLWLTIYLVLDKYSQKFWIIYFFLFYSVSAAPVQAIKGWMNRFILQLEFEWNSTLNMSSSRIMHYHLLNNIACVWVCVLTSDTGLSSLSSVQCRASRPITLRTLFRLENICNW